MPAKREADNVHGFHTQHIHVQKGHLCKTGQPTANTATVQKSRARMDWSSLISWGGAGGTRRLNCLPIAVRGTGQSPPPKGLVSLQKPHKHW